VTAAAIAAFGQVVGIDLVLAGDNAIVIGALAASLPPAQQRKVVAVGIIVAAALRIAFALAAVWLLEVTGLGLLGGLLLVWVAVRMWLDLAAEDDGEPVARPMPRSFARAAIAVAVADVGMSLDNVMGVAGAARGHPFALGFGLLLSIALMGVAASVIARLMSRFRWIGYVGLVLILFIAAGLILNGATQLRTVWGI